MLCCSSGRCPASAASMHTAHLPPASYSALSQMWAAQVKDFVDRYMPAYQAYLPRMYKEGPAGAAPDKVLMFEINEKRQLAPHQPPLPQQGDVDKYVLGS